MQVEHVRVKVGSLIGDDKGQVLRDGVYRADGKLYSSKFGVLKKSSQLVEGKQQQVIAVDSLKSGKRSNIGLSVGDVLICRIVKIRQDGAWVQVLQINSTPCRSIIEGFIRRQLIRQKQIDKIKVHECFLPGDIVKAKFTSFGDGRRIYLSTSAEELGVIYAKSSTSGKLMLPFSWTEMVCLQTGLKQPRKVAKPSLS